MAFLRCIDNSIHNSRSFNSKENKYYVEQQNNINQDLDELDRGTKL